MEKKKTIAQWMMLSAMLLLCFPALAPSDGRAASPDVKAMLGSRQMARIEAARADSLSPGILANTSSGGMSAASVTQDRPMTKASQRATPDADNPVQAGPVGPADLRVKRNPKDNTLSVSKDGVTWTPITGRISSGLDLTWTGKSYVLKGVGQNGVTRWFSTFKADGTFNRDWREDTSVKGSGRFGLSGTILYIAAGALAFVLLLVFYLYLISKHHSRTSRKNKLR